MIGRPWNGSSFHRLKPPPVTGGVATGPFSFPCETFADRGQRAGAGTRGGSAAAPGRPRPAGRCRGDQSLLTALPGSRGRVAPALCSTAFAAASAPGDFASAPRALLASGWGRSLGSAAFGEGSAGRRLPQSGSPTCSHPGGAHDQQFTAAAPGIASCALGAGALCFARRVCLVRREQGPARGGRPHWEPTE